MSLDHGSKKTSIVITCHNYGKFLKKAIESALSQSLKPKEIIVVNDSSIDNTEEVAKSFGNKIKYYFVDFKNAQKTRNFGLEKSTGEFIVFLDADDYFHKDFLRYTQKELERDKELVLVYTDRINLIDKNIQEKLKLEKEWKTKEFNYEELKKGNYISITSLIRKNFFKGFDENIARLQDWEAWLRLLKNKKAKRVPKYLFFVRFHGENKTLRVNLEPEIIKVSLKHNLKDLIELLFQQKNQELQAKDQEIQLMKSSKFWKLRERYLYLKNGLKFVFFSPHKFIKKHFLKK